MKLESYPSATANRKARKPLRTAKELAQDCGVTMAQLRGRLGAEGAPKPEVVHHNNSYYEPVAFIRWFRRAHCGA